MNASSLWVAVVQPDDDGLGLMRMTLEPAGSLDGKRLERIACALGVPIASLMASPAGLGDPPSLPDRGAMDEMTCDLVSYFSAIKDPEKRALLLRLTRELAESSE